MLSSLYKAVDSYVAGINKWIDERVGEVWRKRLAMLLLVLASLLSGYGLGTSIDKANVEQPKIEKGE